MKKTRIPETDSGITGKILVQDYDQMQKQFRNRGLLETKETIKAGITKGKVLEIGPGPGYLGLEWLNRCPEASLYWLEISPDMLKLAENNAREYQLANCVFPQLGDATQKFPFADNFFSGVFSAGSMHEWGDPIDVFNEIERVLQPGGKFFIGDLKRNVNAIVKLVMKTSIKKKTMKEGLETSLNAAYTRYEVTELLQKSNLKEFNITENPFGLSVVGTK